MEPYDSFIEAECIASGDNPITIADVVTKVLFLSLNMVRHCRCLHCNLLASYAIHRKSTCGVILKLIQKKTKECKTRNKNKEFATNSLIESRG